MILDCKKEQFYTFFSSAHQKMLRHLMSVQSQEMRVLNDKERFTRQVLYHLSFCTNVEKVTVFHKVTESNILLSGIRDKLLNVVSRTRFITGFTECLLRKHSS